MPSLFDLTPAEYYMLLAAPKAEFNMALMLTMKDLSLKDVIDIRVETIESRSSSKRVRKHAFVYSYTNFDTYRFRSHERVFKKVLANSGGKVMLLSWLKKIYDIIPSESQYGRIIKEAKLSGCFWPINLSFSKLSASKSKKGKALVRGLNIEMQNHVQELKNNLVNNPSVAWELTKELNGFLYLMAPSDVEDIITILGSQNDKILHSGVSEKIYAWFLEMEKLKEFDAHFYRATQSNNYGRYRRRNSYFGHHQ